MRSDQNELDLWLLLSVFILLGISISMVYSASLLKSLAIYGDRYFIVKSQVFWIFMGIIILVISSNVDYKVYSKISKPVLVAVIILMVLVFVPGISHQVGKAKRWIKLGFIGFQPSEFAKLGLVVYLAALLSRRKAEISEFSKAFLPGLIVTGVLVALALLQSNLGTSIILFLLAFCLFFTAGVRVNQMALVFLSFVPVLVFAVIRESYRLKRIFAYLDPWKFPDTTGYNIIQAWRSFFNGGIFGVGLGHSVQKMNSLPAPHTDFILAVLAEEAGILGVLLLVGLFLVILVRGLSIAARTRDEFGQLLALGVTMMVLLQAAVNMGVVTGVLPTTGLVLPFVSYGGSSLITNMFGLGILLNIHKANVSRKGVNG